MELIPECMIQADGSPCTAFAILQEKIEQQRLRIADLQINSPAQAALDEIKRLRAALEPFARYYKLNDCHWRGGDEALEVPIRDLRTAAFTLEQKAAETKP